MQPTDRAPLACGALGDYSRERVLAIAARLGDGCQSVHEDSGSILLLDREPLRWSGSRQRGLAWIEGCLWRDGVGGWTEASRRGACGLAIEGRRRYLHSSVNGIGPVYWIEQGGATYFASRIEPLVETSPTRLSVDWDAWAAIFALRYPLGELTPFAEIRRLGPSSSLRRRLGRARAKTHRWAWAEIEPELDFEAGAGAAAGALRDALAPLDEEVVCPLSGGLDSRLLLATISSLPCVSPLALTVSDDEGGHFEQDLAAPVAQMLGVPHQEIDARVEDYPEDWRERAARVEHQFVDHAWLVPLARRVESASGPVLDGFALDTLTQTGARFHRPDVIDPPSARAGTRALFDSLRQYGLAHEALELRFRAPVVERSREQFEAAVRPLEGHPSQPVLALYATRTVRGISTYPSGLLGQGATVLTPGAEDAVVTAVLSASSAAKRGRSMHAAIQRHLAPQLAGLASTGDTPRTPPTLERRWRSEPALAMHRHLLEDGPLAPHLAPELLSWVSEPRRGELSPHLRLGMEAVSLFHSWWHRYRDRLREVDPADLLG
jgi:Asparagine synthase